MNSGMDEYRASYDNGVEIRDFNCLTHAARLVFDYPPTTRKVVYTTNAIESLNYSLWKIIKGPGAFPHDDARRVLSTTDGCLMSLIYTEPEHPMSRPDSGCYHPPPEIDPRTNP